MGRCDKHRLVLLVAALCRHLSRQHTNTQIGVRGIVPVYVKLNIATDTVQEAWEAGGKDTSGSFNLRHTRADI
jgi:hypothetical protein